MVPVLLFGLIGATGLAVVFGVLGKGDQVPDDDFADDDPEEDDPRGAEAEPEAGGETKEYSTTPDDDDVPLKAA